MVKVIFNFYLNLNFKHKILIERNLTYRKPFMRGRSLFFFRKAY